jgi:hypothetical protein
MKIEIVDSVKSDIKKDAIPEILNRMFTVCQYDESFQGRNNTDELDEKIARINEKIKKQDYLLSKSEQMKTEMNNKIMILEENNVSLRTQLLEALGSEL